MQTEEVIQEQPVIEKVTPPVEQVTETIPVTEKVERETIEPVGNPDKLKIDKEEVTLSSVNPTGNVFIEYTPEKRAKMPLADNITTLDKTMNESPNKIITIYRGAPKKQKSIVSGDFITTNKQLAKDYAGTGIVLEKKVKLSDILDDNNEPLGEEYIYKPQEVINAEETGTRIEKGSKQVS